MQTVGNALAAGEAGAPRRRTSAARRPQAAVLS